MFWAYGSYVGGKLLVLVSIAILARLLSPEAVLRAGSRTLGRAIR